MKLCGDFPFLEHNDIFNQGKIPIAEGVAISEDDLLLSNVMLEMVDQFLQKKLLTEQTAILIFDVRSAYGKALIDVFSSELKRSLRHIPYPFFPVFASKIYLIRLMGTVCKSSVNLMQNPDEISMVVIRKNGSSVTFAFEVNTPA